jgi:outer membrane protein
MTRPTIALAMVTLFAAGSAFAQTSPAQSGSQPSAPAPFPEGSRIAWVDIQMVAANSDPGKQYTARITEFQTEKNDELSAKQKELQETQQKLQQGATVLSDSARLQLERDIDRMTRELQFMTQNAQAEVQDLQVKLQAEFQAMLGPVIEEVATAHDLEMLFSVGDSGLVWADSRLDLTQEIIAEVNAAMEAAGGSQP